MGPPPDRTSVALDVWWPEMDWKDSVVVVLKLCRQMLDAFFLAAGCSVDIAALRFAVIAVCWVGLALALEDETGGQKKLDTLGWLAWKG